MNIECSTQPKFLSILKLLKNEVKSHLSLIEGALNVSESDFSEAEFSVIQKAVSRIRGAAKICGFEAIVSLAKELQTAFPASSDFRNLYRPSLEQFNNFMELFSQLEESSFASFLDEKKDELSRIKRFFIEKPLPVKPIPKRALNQPVSKTDKKPGAIGIKPGSKLFDMFRTGVKNHSQILNSGLETMGTNPTLENLEPITRAAHSLKGSTRIVGLHAPASIANAMENVFLSVQSGTAKLSPKLILALQKGAVFFSRLAEINPAEIGLWLTQQESLINRLTQALEDGKTDVSDLIFSDEPATAHEAFGAAVIPDAVPSPVENADRPHQKKIMAKSPDQELDEQTSKMLGNYSIKVLLIDDEVLVGETVRQMLAGEEDIVFYSAQNPWLAFQKALEIEPTVILQDLVMPDVDGLQMVLFFRNHPSLTNVPLIVLSSRKEAVTKAEAFVEGANDYLEKLPDKIELIARIRYHSKGYINLRERNDAFSVLIKSRRELAEELSYAIKYIVSLLPKPVREGPIRAEWRFIPSTQLGGDTLGYHWIKPNLLAMYLLDVSGHGIKSALLSVTAYNVLTSQTLPDTDFARPDQVCYHLNETFQMEKHNNLSFTIWYGVYDKETRILSYASAGHPPALLFPSDKTPPIEMSCENTLIGAFPGVPYEMKTHLIEPGSSLYIFSDGVYEVRNPDGEFWDISGLKDYLLKSSSPDHLEVENLYHHLLAYSHAKNLGDDYSILKLYFP
ncbi:MAG: SpoIIE family protein phosphatase [Candidatus Riflebacteria bacterium]|nr:SpoIIE family protein phosphatase [Candidatus Riflebacteria bacterium]